MSGPSRVEVGVPSAEMKEGLIKMMQEPKYRAAIDRFAQAMRQWATERPRVELLWQPSRGLLLLGGGLDSAEVRNLIAANAAAHHCLVYADRATGCQCSSLQAQQALVLLDWMPA
jgi:hypothetical protein